jgi:hypothetical protein
VLELNESKAVKLLLVSIGNKTERVEKAKRGLGSELRFDGVEGSLGGRLGGRGESRSSGKEGGNNSELHGERVYWKEETQQQE